jgi:hypothetical protein
MQYVGLHFSPEHLVKTRARVKCKANTRTSARAEGF